MKTHKSRWYQNSPTTWILKEPSRDGGAVLAVIAKSMVEGYGWRLGESEGGEYTWVRSFYTAQRQVRQAMNRIKADHTAPEHEEAIRWVDDITLRMKLMLLGEEHEPITVEELGQWFKHRRELEQCRRRLLFY